MNPEIERRIDARESWTHRECIGLAAEFSTKPRYVIALVHARGKRYIDNEHDSKPDPDKFGS